MPLGTLQWPRSWDSVPLETVMLSEPGLCSVQPLIPHRELPSSPNNLYRAKLK